VIVQTGAGARVAAGCQGGRAQPQVLAQVARALASPTSDLDAALRRPRWVTGARDMGRRRETVLAEPGAAPPHGEAAAAGVPVEQLDEPSDLAGHVQVARVARGTLEAASDPRADGAGAVFAASRDPVEGRMDPGVG
jgi:gamma-glutamyltranspeptidase